MRRNVLLLALIAALSQGCSGRNAVKFEPSLPPSAESREKAQEMAEQAQRQAQRGNIDGAIELYRGALEYDREMAQSWNNLGVLLMQQQRFPQAVAAFDEAANLWPTDPRPVANIGHVWLELGYARDALTQFEDALLREPTDLPSLRGAIRAAHLLDIADEKTSEWIKVAIYNERDTDWAEYFQVQRSRVEGRLSSERRASRP